VINETRRLSVGGTAGTRVFLAAFGVVFAAIGAAFVILPFAADGLLRRLTGPSDDCTFSTGYDAGDVESLPPEVQHCFEQSGGWGLFEQAGGWSVDGGFGPGRLIGLCGIPFVLIGLYGALRALRAAVWLDGTEVKVRSAFGTRAVDLATAEVTVGAVAFRQGAEGAGPGVVRRLPTLVARDPGTGRQVTVPLHGAGDAPLPPHELRALADAMTRGRRAGGRDADVHTIARQLHTMADNPLGL
jgi:hypothetical protein